MTIPFRRHALPVLVLLAVVPVSLAAQVAVAADATTGDLPITPQLKKIFRGGEPSTLAEVVAMEAYVQALRMKVLPSVVNIGGASGVIVPGGYVLTAGHVTRSAGRRIRVTLDNGRGIQTKSLGLSNSTDTGLLKIETEGAFPALPMGKSGALRRGQWCVMFGFPGGSKPGLKPPIRLGRVLRVVAPGRGYLVTDCTMSAGDSGGPLFDMQGRVIGINSRISRDLAMNMHTPIDAFHQEWDRLLAGEVMGRRRGTQPRRRGRPTTPGWLGVVADLADAADAAKVESVVPGSPAAKAGVRPGDVVLKLNSRRIRSPRTLLREERKLWKGERVRITVRRDGKELVLNGRVGTKPAGPPKQEPRKQEPPKPEPPKSQKKRRVIR